MSNGILIADDRATARKAILAYLNQRNFEVCGEAIDGVDAVAKATELEPALILLDLRMPRMNGVQAASVLRSGMPNVRGPAALSGEGSHSNSFALVFSALASSLGSKVRPRISPSECRAQERRVAEGVSQKGLERTRNIWNTSRMT
jgi:DNA-binding NarL/FixJ family response regulator